MKSLLRSGPIRTITIINVCLAHSSIRIVYILFGPHSNKIKIIISVGFLLICTEMQYSDDCYFRLRLLIEIKRTNAFDEILSICSVVYLCSVICKNSIVDAMSDSHTLPNIEFGYPTAQFRNPVYTMDIETPLTSCFQQSIVSTLALPTDRMNCQ